MDDLARWVTRAQAGETDAYERIVRRFQDMAYRYAYGILSDFDLAQDAAQEAFVEAYLCLPNLREPLAFAAWFKRIVFKHCDRLTRGKRVPIVPLETVGELAADIPGPAEMTERNEAQDSLVHAIRSLPENERQVIALYYGGGYAQDEIVAFLEVPASTIKSRLHAARKRLKERMFEMVRDALKGNALPENFTQETIARAVAKAEELNKQHQFAQAEELLRDVLDKAPDHARALRALNRTLMWGQYEDRRFDRRWNELVVNGQAIIDAGSDDETVWHEMAQTLMYIPRMGEAAAHIEAWIDKKGPSAIRLGMLAWVRSCLAEYGRAESLWNEMLSLIPHAPAEEAATIVQHVCMSIVDCLASAGAMERAARVAQTGWEASRDLDAFPHLYGDPPQRRTDFQWLQTLYQAGLRLDDAAQRLLDKLGPEGERDLFAQGMALNIRAWIEDVRTMTADWLAWAKSCVKAEAWSALRWISSNVSMALRLTGRPEALSTWARVTRKWLETVPGPEAQALHEQIKWSQYNGWTYLEVGDLGGAERVAREGLAQEGDPLFAVFLVGVAIRRGEPTPREALEIIETHGLEHLDDYGMEGWYIVAREAAAAGDAEKAFGTLARALDYWSNPPLYFDGVWERDAYWGELRQHPEYKRIFEEKRQRIGPIHGQLHYFPGW